MLELLREYYVSGDSEPFPAIDELVIPEAQMSIANLVFDRKTSTWTYNDELFSGYGIDYFGNGRMKSKVGILNGKRQGKSIHWYPDGHYQFVSNHHRGKLHGEKRIWSDDEGHLLVAHLNYSLNKGHGRQVEWYRTGQVFKIRHFNMGREEGIQQAFRKNGDLYANYETKNGRIFGMKKSALCFGLAEEGIVSGD